MENADIKYLKVLATQYPNIAAAATEIVNLKAILSLPKAPSTSSRTFMGSTNSSVM